MKRAAVCVIHFFLLTYGLDLLAQSKQRVSLIPEQSEIKISGSSNISDWEEEAERFNVSLDLSFEGNEISAIHGIQATIQTKSIKSKHNRMTVKTHQSLNEKEYPNIEYRFTSMEKLVLKKGQMNGTVVGNLTIAGITRPVQIQFTGIIMGKKMTLSGLADMDMNDFHIKAPSAMLGIIRTDKNVTVKFKLLFLLER